ncbi:ABC transporter ATP-binding protein [Hymenobacter sp. BT770]|uniref:ABC transporter ATP-binding protein n=1 Tax=Hymenobacter sp. BT770 TaxID=2886942 RepID=UPI001D12F81B|nr:ABC transporter ATP-binding protein [Hymenobacter sp. BT770]MCC3155379.1 ABC transporter ATP-binding protein/permease [Hymenobacter sp. BT770]MDO3417392.1 ABC transporter ATP-binding protein [Hymenobacter sp. BT770]
MNLWQIIRRLIPYVRPYRSLVAATLLLTLIGAITAQVNPFVLRYTVDSVQRLLAEGQGLRGGTPLLLTISLILIAKELITIALEYGQNFFGEEIRIYVSSALSQDAVRRILSYRLGFYAELGNQTGRLQTRLDKGVDSLMKLVQDMFIDILPLLANAAVALGIMFAASWELGVVALSVLPVYFGLSYWQALRLSDVRSQMRRLREDKNHGLLNLIDSAVVIKSFVREDYEEQKQNILQLQLRHAQLNMRKTNFLFDGLKSFVEQLGVVFIVVLTAYLVLAGRMSLGAIMFHIMLFRNVSAPIRQLHRMYDELNEVHTYSEAFFEMLDAPDAVEPSGPVLPTHLRGTFELRHVSFTYPSGTQALHDVSLTIPAGKTTALVGLSGAGKSTVINLLCKFYLPQRGELLLDGIPLTEYDTHALRQQIGLVLQKNHIFKGTVEENIRYGLMEASREEVEQAAAKAFLHEQIVQLPEGYETDAQQLSGGQQQRIAIARLFLKNPPIIFLDEPTASLDAITTEQIKASIDALKRGRTVVIISHSLSQIVDADFAYVLQKGQVVESGTHRQLYELDGAYRRIFDASARSLNIEKIAQTLTI